MPIAELVNPNQTINIKDLTIEARSTTSAIFDTSFISEEDKVRIERFFNNHPTRRAIDIGISIERETILKVTKLVLPDVFSKNTGKETLENLWKGFQEKITSYLNRVQGFNSHPGNLVTLLGVLASAKVIFPEEFNGLRNVPFAEIKEKGLERLGKGIIPDEPGFLLTFLDIGKSFKTIFPNEDLSGFIDPHIEAVKRDLLTLYDEYPSLQVEQFSHLKLIHPNAFKEIYRPDEARISGTYDYMNGCKSENRWDTFCDRLEDLAILLSPDSRITDRGIELAPRNTPISLVTPLPIERSF